MGVIQLWSVLAPVKKHVPLSDLKGQTLAVDLSIWVCESNAVRQMQGVVLKPHLRNLFFRVSNLTQMGIKLIFAIDGEAPDLKRDTMAKRQQARHQGKHKTTSSLSKPKRKGRSQFNTILKECCELLSHLGIPYIYSQGEAEALCALLNRQGIADGCLTEDGDAFLYGARTVYRNFTLNTKDPHVESYCGEDIEKSLGLGQEGLVGLALLLGCDYLPKGVPGVGKEQVLKLVKLLEGVNILDRFEAWQTEDGSNLEGIEKAVWKKAMKVENFPNHEVINEFLVAKDTCAAKEFRQRRPWIEKLQDFLFQKLDWPREYTEEKVLPLITLWDMTDILLTGQHKPALHLVPHRIVKRRVRQGVPCLEVEWMRQDNATEDNPYYTTIEEEDKFTQCFTETMGLFEGMEKARKVSKGRKKVKADKAHSKAPAEEDDMVSLVAERLNNLDLDIKISEVMLSDFSTKVNCEKSDAMSAGNEDFPPRIQTLKRNTRVTVKSGQDEQVYDSAIVNSKVKTKMENSSSGTLTELSARNSESSDDDSVSEYIPLSQRIKMAAMKDSCIKVKTTQGERQNKPDFVTEKMGNSPRQKQIVENDTFTRSDDDVKGTDHRLIGHDTHLSETSSPVAAEDHNQANVSNSRPTIIIISTAGGDNSDQHLSSPQKIVNLSSEKVVGFSDSDAGNGSVYELFSPDGDASLVRGDGDSLLGTAEVNALVTDETVRTSDVITITCVPEDASGMEPDQSILCTCDNSIDLFSSESVCASPQIMDNKIYTNRGNPFSSPDLSSGLTRMLSPSLQQNHEQGNSIKDGLLRSSPGIPHDLSSMKVFLNDSGVNTVSTPQTSSVKLRERVPFDSPDLCGISPGYGYFYLETSLLNDTTGSQDREPLTPITCNKEMKVKPTRIECEKKSAECDNDDILVTLSKTADMVEPVEVNAVDCGKESKETVTKARSPLNEMCYASICTSKNLNKTKQLCQCSEGFDLHKDNLHTQNVSKSIVSAVSSILSTSCQPVSADISKQSSICKELSSGKENKLTRKTKKQRKSNCSSKSTQKIEEPDHVDFCIDKIAKLHVKENASDLNPTSPMALVDRLKSKFASLGTVPISGETILSVKRVNSK